MSAYDNDPRVRSRLSGGLPETDVLAAESFDVHCADGSVGAVWRRGGSRWTARREVGTYQHFDTADEAIRSPIGDPQ